MRFLEKLPKPGILERKASEWTDSFLAQPDKKRPDNSKYAHKDIREQLHSMSFHKCFYCERKLGLKESEIDHYKEVADPAYRALAFEWENLYLACHNNCNNKIPHKTIPVTDALNPCLHTDNALEQHLTFDRECITSKNSELGLNTIKKYRLDNPLLDKLRSDKLHQFKDVLLKIQKNQITDGRKNMTTEELDSLKYFAQADQSFSLMFRLLLKKIGLFP